MRDEFIDFCRAFSLIVVVLWHWVFTILIWGPDGPHASNPIGFTTGLWLLTWLFQVLPVFFFVGGYAHMNLYEKTLAQGGGYWRFVGERMRRLAVPSLALLGFWIVAGATIIAVFDAPWFENAVVLIVSPLWFIAVYLMLVVVAPPMLWLHRRLGPVVVVVLAGTAFIVDVARFQNGVNGVAFVNLVVVWALCHQLGFFYGRLRDAPRQVTGSFAIGGLLWLIGLVNTNIYPGSMVGVPGGEISNMGPPTLCIVALCLFQVGLIMLIRPWVLRRIHEPRWERVNDVMNRFALPLFLFHTTGMAIAFAVLYWVGYRPPQEPTVSWWLQRPIWLFAPLFCTLPVIFLFGRQWVTPKAKREAEIEGIEAEPVVTVPPGETVALKIKHW